MLNIPEKGFLKSLAGCTKKALAEFKPVEQNKKNKKECILDYGKFFKLSETNINNYFKQQNWL